MRWGEIIRQLVLIPPTLFGVAVIVFVLLRVVPGDPIAMMIPPGASAADIDRLRAFYGLDQSIPQQFVTWFGQALTGDFGRSISLHQSVFELVRARLPATLELALMATLIAVALGTMVALIGIYVRGRRAEWADRWRHRRLSRDSRFPLGADPAAAVRRADPAAADLRPHRSATRRHLPDQFLSGRKPADRPVRRRRMRCCST